ncbi:MAG: hypothetical protein WCO93_01300 [bacterium]
MTEKIATALSFIFHPLFFPLYTLIILLVRVNLYTQVPFEYNLLLSGIVLLTTLLFPVLIIFILYKKKIISSFFLSVREERIYPILCVAAFYYLTYYLLKGVLISGFFGYYMLGATLLAIFALLITFFHKVSLHMISIGAFNGLFFGLMLGFGTDFLLLILLGLLLSGLLGFARLKTNAHKPAEIYSGFLLGFTTMSLLIALL